MTIVSLLWNWLGYTQSQQHCHILQLLLEINWKQNKFQWKFTFAISLIQLIFRFKQYNNANFVHQGKTLLTQCKCLLGSSFERHNFFQISLCDCSTGNYKTPFVGDVTFAFAFVQCEITFKYCTEWYILAFDVTMVTVVTATGWT